jgi:phage baseplate assembly protein W
VSSLDDERYGRDLAVPLDPDAVVRVTPTGDLPSVSGLANFSAAMQARAITSQGELLHRPKYGAGLLDAVEGAGTPGARARLANALRRNLLADPRVDGGGEVRVSVVSGTPDDPTREGAITATVVATPRGLDQSVTLTLSASE